MNEESYDEPPEQPDWPREFDELVAKLGKPQSVHRFLPKAFRRRILLGFLGIFVSIIINIVYWYILKFRLVDKFVLLLLFGPGVLGFGLIVQSLRHRGLWVLRYPTGLLCWRRGMILSFPWEEIMSFKISAYQSKTTLVPVYVPSEDEETTVTPMVIPLEAAAGRYRIIQLTLKRTDGTEFTLPSSLEGFTDLGRDIQMSIFQRQWPVMETEFLQGRIFEVATVKIQREGIATKKEILSWIDFDEAVLEANILNIRKQDRRRPWHSLAINAIENPHLVMHLLTQGYKIYARSFLQAELNNPLEQDDAPDSSF
jgi:hypothetical protein